MHLPLVALRNLAVLPDVADVALDDDLPRSLFDATCENRVWVARRRVFENEINLRVIRSGCPGVAGPVVARGGFIGARGPTDRSA